jgi:fructokinase
MFASKPQKIVCFGEQLTAYISEEKACGGGAAHVAAAIARLGGAARFIGKADSDASGKYLRGELEAAGVEVKLVETGEPDDAWLDDAAVYHFGSVPLLEKPFRTSSMAAALRIKEAGGLISYCPEPEAALWPDEQTMRRDLLVHMGIADIVKVSENQISFFTGMEPAEAVQELLGLGVKAVIVTQGEDGCCVVTEHAMTSIPGIRVKVVDAAGAGDSFVGAMLFKLAACGATAEQIEAILTDEERVRMIFSFANKAGAMTTTRRGVLTALPTLAEIEEIED